MLEGLLDRFRQVMERAGVRAVYGDPVHAHGRILIPVARVVYGFGAGGGRRQRHEQEEDDEEERQHDEGGGGGAALSARPVAVLEIRGDETRVIPVWDANRVALAALLALAWMAFWLSRRRPP